MEGTGHQWRVQGTSGGYRALVEGTIQCISGGYNTVEGTGYR